MTLSTGVRILVAGSVVAAALSLAPGAARAQTNATCGALASGAANCPNAAYDDGIVYWNQESGVTLTVPGAAAGTTITASTTGWNGLDVGVSIRTSAPATEARNVSLTVGGGGDVNIVQGASPEANAWYRNHGILVGPLTANGSTITVDVKSGVTIGAANNRMRNRGIVVWAVDGAGDVSVASAAAVYSGEAGIYIENAGAGAVTVTNSGAIDTGDRGIYVRDTGSAGAITVTNSGAITSSATSYDEGIYARTTGKDSEGASAGVEITHSAGAIAVTGGIGILAHVGAARQEADTEHDDYVAPLNAGLAKVSVTGGSVTARGSAVEAINYEAGSVEVRVSSGVTLASTQGYGIEARLTDAGNTAGTITVANAAAITAGTAATGGDADTAVVRHGIAVNRDAGSGDVSVTNSGAIAATGDGVSAVARGGGGALSVTNSGALGTAAARVGRGIFASHEGAGRAGAVTVTSSGAIASTGAGIFARTIGKDAAGANAGAAVTHSAGAIASADGRGIKVYVGERRQESDTSHDDYVAPRNTGLAKVEVTGGSISSKWEPIEAFNHEGGSIEVRVSPGVALTSTHGHGIRGALTDAGAAGGGVTVDNAGTIRAPKAGITFAISAGSGDISVTNSGAIGKADARATHGIFVSHDGAGATGAVEVTNRGDIHATDRGILAQTKFLDADGARDGATVTHSAGTINVTNPALVDGDQTGIVARVGNWRREREPDHDDYVAPKNTGAVRIDVTGGLIVAKGSAVEGANYEAGGVAIEIAKGVTLRSTHEHAVEADLRDVGNAGGTIGVTQAGTIAAWADGVSAKVTRMDPVTAPDTPVIDIVWTGTFTAVEGEGGGVPNVARAVGAAQGRQAVEAAGIRFAHASSGGAGIDAGVMKWQAFMRPVSEGDDPGEFADAAAVTALFADGADAATKARAAAIVTRFRSVLADESLGTIPGADAIDADDDDAYSDAEIVAYLSEDDAARRTLLRNILTQSFTEHEMAVFRAVLTDGDVEAALAAAPDSYGDAWKAGVRALLARRNDGNISIAMNGGSIVSSGDGIRAFFGRTHDDNGAIRITVAEGASVTGGVAGIYAENAGHGLRIAKKYTSPAVQARNENLGPDDLVTFPKHHDQIVEVHGTVTGGTDAAVHLAGGGALILGKTGKLVAGSSGRAVLVNHPGPAVIRIDGEATGGEGAPAAVHLTGGGSVAVGLDGSVRASGADAAIRGDNMPTAVVVETGETVSGLTQEGAAKALARIEGGIVGDGVERKVIIAGVEDGVATGHARDLPLDDEGEPVLDGLPKAGADEPTPPPAPMPAEFSCAAAEDGRCRLYEALPSVLLAMNALPTRDERLAAARDGRGSWARVETARGKWKADSSTQTGVAYDHRRHGVRVGLDFPAGENSGVGASVHGFRGSATTRAMAGLTHEVELSGMGLGAHATTTADDIYVDAQAAVTWFDATLTSSTHGVLEDGAEGLGWALGLEAGRRVALDDGLSVTPRAGLGWSQATLDDFTDEVDDTRVSLKDAQSLTGRAGLGVEASGGEGVRLSGSVDAMHEFADETQVDVMGSALMASGPATSVRFGLDGAFALADSAQLRAAASYTASGSDTHVWGGGERHRPLLTGPESGPGLLSLAGERSGAAAPAAPVRAGGMPDAVQFYAQGFQELPRGDSSIVATDGSDRRQCVGQEQSH